MKVKFSNIEKPLCYGLKNEEQYQNGTEATYLLYSDPRTGKQRFCVTCDTFIGWFCVRIPHPRMAYGQANFYAVTCRLVSNVVVDTTWQWSLLLNPKRQKGTQASLFSFNDARTGKQRLVSEVVFSTLIMQCFATKP